jgi:hypothetical protein
MAKCDSARVLATLENMARDPGDAKVQARACAELEDAGTRGVYPQPLFAKVIKALCQAMAQFPEDEQINSSSISLVTDACRRGDPNAAVAAREGFVSALLRAMRTNPKMHCIQKIGCACKFVGLPEIPRM